MCLVCKLANAGSDFAISAQFLKDLHFTVNGNKSEAGDALHP